ncbi:MAG: transposase [Candidatus Nanopelagicales bacterium]|nr:transposase [Candidatus Nanopelagicales bacterium]
MVPVWLNRAQFRTAHEGAHSAAMLWNELVVWVRAEWAAGRSPGKGDIGRFAVGLDRSRFPLHAHSVQAIAHDLFDAIATSRTNRKLGIKTRSPWREKKYRPLHFTRNFGWRVTAEGKLNLSFGQGKGKGSRRPSITLPLPDVRDARTGLSVPPSAWGEIVLCWDRDARRWSLRIPYRTTVPTLPQGELTDPGTVLVGVDEGIINPMALAARSGNRVEGLVISGRGIRSIKRLRNKHIGSLQKALSRTKNGSRKHKRLVAKKRKVQAKTDRQLRNADHHVSRLAANWMFDLATDGHTGEIRPVVLAVGDVRGIERNTNRKRRASRSTRQQLSQWSRGRQERYLAEKTGLRIDYIPEAHTSQTCPTCGHRRKPSGRVYACPTCGNRMNRDLVGAGNIQARANNGGDRDTAISPWIDGDTTVTVKYRRSQRHWSPDQCARHGFHQLAQQRAGTRDEKSAVEAQNRASQTRLAVAKEQLVSQPTTNLAVRGRGRSAPTPAQIPA